MREQLETRAKSFLRRLVFLFKNRQLLGIDLFDIIEDEELVLLVHRNACKYLHGAEYHEFSKIEKYTIFTSLALIGFTKYSGNFWDNVHQTYRDVRRFYSSDSEQVVEQIIRELVSEYYSGPAIQQRKINWLLMLCVVPQHYLFEYFDLMLEVYVHDLRASLPEMQSELDEVLTSIVKQIIRKRYSAQDEFQSKIMNQSYKLIKSTRDAMASRIYRPSVVTFSREIIMRLEGMVLTNKAYEGKKDYLQKQVEQWFEERGNHRYEKLLHYNTHSGKRRKAIQWSPAFLLRDQQLYLATRTIFISDDVDYMDISIKLDQGDRTVYHDKEPEVISDDGLSLEIPSVEIPIRFDPFDLKLTMTGVEIGEYELKSSYLMFNADGRQIKKIDGKHEMIFVVAKDLSDSNAHILSENGHYHVGYFNPDQTDYLRIKDVHIPTKSYDEIDISGTPIDDVYIKVNQRTYPVYKNDVVLCIPNQDIYRNASIQINEKLKKLELREEDPNDLVVHLDDLENGFNIIKMVDEGGRRIDKTKEFRFFIDDDMEFFSERIDDDITVRLSSGFLEEGFVEFSISPEDADQVFFEGRIAGIGFEIHVNLNVPMIAREDGPYHLMSDELWHEDFNYYERATIKGVSADTLEITSEDNVFGSIAALDSVEGPRFEFDIGTLKTTHRNLNLKLNFLRNNTLVHAVDFLNHVEVSKEDLIVHFRPGDSEVKLKVNQIRGKGDVRIVIKERTHVLAEGLIGEERREFIWRPERWPVQTVIECIDVAQNVLLTKKDRYFYRYDDLVGHTFKINEVSLGICTKPDYNYRIDSDEQRYTYIILDRRSADGKTYIGRIYYLSRNDEKRFYHIIDYITMDIPSRIDHYRTIVAYVYADDDYAAMIYDRKAHRILDIREEPKGVREVCTIDEYILEMVE